MLRAKMIGVVLLTLALVGLIGPVPPANAAPSRWPQTISARSASLHPEGVAWDPTRQGFLVSSIQHGTVSLVRRDGEVRPLLADPRMVSTFGVHIDTVRRRVLVAYADIGQAERSTPTTVFSSSGVGIFDLATGRLLHLVNLNIGPGKHGANDLAIAPDGTAYVTDSSSDTIYQVTPDGRGSALVVDARLASPSIGMNGIVYDPSGVLLAVRYDTGALLRIPVRHPHQIHEVALAHPLIGGDGLALRSDGSLIAVTNKFGAPGVEAVTELRSNFDWSAARVVRRAAPWPIAGPSTVALSPHGAYVLSGRIEVLLSGSYSDEFDLRRL